MELRVAAGFFLEEIENRCEGVRNHGEQGFVDQRKAQLGFHGFAGLIGHADFHFAILAGKKGLLEWFQYHLEFAFDP